MFGVHIYILGSLQSFRIFFCDGPIKEAHAKKTILNLDRFRPLTNLHEYTLHPTINHYKIYLSYFVLFVMLRSPKPRFIMRHF
jgi:hypothetical protein